MPKPVQFPVKVDLKTYSPEYREWAFMLWAAECNQSYTKLHARLTQNTDPDDPFPRSDVTVRALKIWSRNENWSHKFVADFGKVARHNFDMVTAKLGMFSMAAADVLLDIAMDPTKNEMARVKAAEGLLSRAGHMEHKQLKDGSKPEGPARVYEISAAGKSSKDLVESINGRLRRLFEEPDANVIDVEARTGD